MSREMTKLCRYCEISGQFTEPFCDASDEECSGRLITGLAKEVERIDAARKYQMERALETCGRAAEAEDRLRGYANQASKTAIRLVEVLDEIDRLRRVFQTMVDLEDMPVRWYKELARLALSIQTRPCPHCEGTGRLLVSHGMHTPPEYGSRRECSNRLVKEK